MGKIYYLMGKSASGKDTIYKRILKEYPEIKKVVLYTTRPMRDGEKNGNEYFFITSEELNKFKDQGKIIEKRTYQTVEGPWTYATVDDGNININQADYLAIGTLESYEKVVSYYGKEIVCPIYITVDDGIRLERALMREKLQKAPKYAEMCRRFLADEADFSKENLEKNEISRSFENDNIEKCIAEIVNFMKN